MSATKFLNIVFLILLLSILSGCSRSAPRDVMMDSFIGGEEGLRVNILQGAPPTVIQDRGMAPFAFVLTLENAGESPVGPGTANPVSAVRLAGIVHSDFNTTPQRTAKTLPYAINGARKNFDGTVLPGEIADISFDDLVYRPDVFDSISLTLRAEICYDYESLATAKFCMKKDTLESAEDSSICTLKGPRPFGTSGAPIKVTQVQQAPLGPGSIKLDFMVENLGRGIFFDRHEPKDLYDACVFEDVNPGMYKLEVLVEPISEGTYDVSCPRLEEDVVSTGGAKGLVRMPFGAPLALSCFITRKVASEQRVYEDLVNIRLRYRYGEFVEVPMLIQGHI